MPTRTTDPRARMSIRRDHARRGTSGKPPSAARAQRARSRTQPHPAAPSHYAAFAPAAQWPRCALLEPPRVWASWQMMGLRVWLVSFSGEVFLFCLSRDASRVYIGLSLHALDPIADRIDTVF